MTSILAALFGPRVRCDECGRAFSPKLRDDPTPSGGMWRHFNCPRCGHHYDVATISPRGVQIAEEIRELTLGNRRGDESSDQLRRNALAIRLLRRQMAREVTRHDG